MSTVQQVAVTIAALLGLAAVVGGLWAAISAANKDARIKRLQEERDDYLSRLNFIEPRLKSVEQQNELLLAMHNPSERLEQLAVQEQHNHEQTVQILQEQSRTLHAIDDHLSDRGRG